MELQVGDQKKLSFLILKIQINLASSILGVNNRLLFVLMSNIVINPLLKWPISCFWFLWEQIFTPDCLIIFNSFRFVVQRTLKEEFKDFVGHFQISKQIYLCYDFWISHVELEYCSHVVIEKSKIFCRLDERWGRGMKTCKEMEERSEYIH